jgi:hypothetical protein
MHLEGGIQQNLAPVLCFLQDQLVFRVIPFSL